MTTNLIIILAHELACSLEMNFEAAEREKLWPEALKGLRGAADHLQGQSLPVPPVVLSVLRASPG